MLPVLWGPIWTIRDPSGSGRSSATSERELSAAVRPDSPFGSFNASVDAATVPASSLLRRTFGA